MLKNDGGLLPLRRAGQRIALIGPFAAGAHDLIGPWNVYGDDADAVDVASGFRAAMADPARLSVTEGSGIETPIAGGIEAAIAAARSADVAVLAIGESAAMSGEAQSRTAIVVPVAQQALAEAVAATGTPLVVLLKNGRGLALEGAVLAAPALLVTWFLGSETGTAIADIVFGRVGPSGRLPVSFPQESGQEPYYYAHKASGRPNPPGPPEPYKAHYRTASNAARFSFGHGLTYGTIGYTALRDGGGMLSWDRTLTVGATVTNTGTRIAEEVVQLYTHRRFASVTRPVRTLVDFRRVVLPPGASIEVNFEVTRASLAFVDGDDRSHIEPGRIDFWIAPSADSGLAGSFELHSG